MIQFSNVSKRYRTGSGEKCVLDAASFTIHRGASVGIVGVNGAGKSTLTRLMAGIEYPDCGRITRHMTVSWPLGFGGAFQGSLTGADNTRFISRIYQRDSLEILRAVEEFAELGAYLHMPVKTYSSGMRARLAFAVSLAIEFECYIVDEVTAVGDKRFRERCAAALRARRNGGTLIMVSHDPGMLREYCESGALLCDGKLTFFDSIDETMQAYEEGFLPRSV